MKAIGTGAFMTMLAATSAPAGTIDSPNIVLIMADDMGYECLGSYGSASYQTPALDRLASEGVLFSECHAQPLCTPSRVKIMTGKYNFRNYLKFAELPPKETTFANVLQDAGYSTCIAGKWQLGGDHAQIGKFGFDEYCLWQLISYPASERGYRYGDPTVFKNGEKFADLTGQYGPDVFADFVIDFIERKKDGPFFVYYPMVLVHDPFVPTPDSPGWEIDRHRGNPKNFKDMVEYTDGLVGKIVEKLDDLDLRENTLILFTGDNGTHPLIVSEMEDGRSVQGGKAFTRDNGTHVPLIANWPGTAPSGKQCSDLISFADFVPTLAETAGAPIPPGIDGVSFLPQVKGQAGQPRDWLYMFARLRHVCVGSGGLMDWNNDPGNITIEPDSKDGIPANYVKCFVRDERWKLYTTGHLYDLQNDIDELEPVLPAEDTPESAAVRGRLKQILNSINSERSQ